jgi:hypothetical protein
MADTSAAPPAESKDYTGHCHCRENCYEVTLSPPLDHQDQKTMQCNCSICELNGYQLTMVAPDAVKWTAGGLDKMTKYNFNTGKFTHFFCSACGSSLAILGEMGGKEFMALNVSTVNQLLGLRN